MELFFLLDPSALHLCLLRCLLACSTTRPIFYLVLPQQTSTLILGLSWLQPYSPVLDWSSSQLPIHGSFLHFLLGKHLPLTIFKVIRSLHYCWSVSCDCTINQIPGFSPFRGWVYPFRDQGQIGIPLWGYPKGLYPLIFFSCWGWNLLWRKERWHSLLYINYCGLNAITVKNHCLLCFIMEIFNCLHRAQVFTKLDCI